MTACATCHQALEIEIESDGEDIGSSSGPEPQTVPDDVELSCGCHFHWQCLLDSYQIMECPNCKRNVSSRSGLGGHEQVLCNLHNEGGLQKGLDILPLLTEESYLRAYPEERKARAFLEFCREGDVEAIIELLNDDEEEMDEEQRLARLSSVLEDDLSRIAKILNYQDPLGSMYSALHVAVINENVEIIWLLLYVASCLDIGDFPAEVLDSASQFGAVRLFGKEAPMQDIRSLKDSEGLSAYNHAEARGLGRVFNINLLNPRPYVA